MQSLMKIPSSDLTSRRVAVIGAGAAGLVASRELRREGHDVVVFERSNRVGGLWVYDPNVETDPLGLNPSRTIVHTSLYESLRTNLPREIMGVRDFPFAAINNDPERDPRRYPSHGEVLNYLENFADHFNLHELIRFETEVVHVGLIGDNGNQKWLVKSSSRSRKSGGADDVVDEVFDAVVVCNGHYTKPRIAEISGIDAWPGKQIHSHNYRVPEPFRNQVVLVIGNGPSAWDISKEIVGVAREVHVASKSLTKEILANQFDDDKMQLHSMIKSAHDDGTVSFEDGSVVSVDIILHCTGYTYDFPFLEINNIVTVDDNRVGPLYKQIFPPLLAPGLAFIGIPVIGFSFFAFEMESKWVAGVLSGRILLPSQREMMEDVEAFYSKLEAEGVPKHYTHRVRDFKEFIDWLTTECGILPCEDWRKQMKMGTLKRSKVQPKTYRDEWDDEHLVLQAQEDFRQYLPADAAENSEKS